MIANNRHVDFWAPVLLISALLMILIALVLGHVARADPDGWQPIATTVPDTSWTLVAQYGPIWGGALLVFGLAGELLKRNEVTHWLPGRSLALATGAVSVLGALLEWRASGGSMAGVVVTAIMAVKLALSPTATPSPGTGGPPTSSGSIATGMLLLLAAGALALQPGCSSGKHAATVGKDAVIHCAKADAGPILALTAELATAAAASALHAGAVDWKALAARAEAAGLEVGGCAFAALYHALEKDRPVARSLVAEPDPGRAALEQLRAGFGGARWEIADGAVL